VIKRILNKYAVSVWIGFSKLRTEAGGGCFEHGNEIFGYVKGG
jgi:hypothetical protein